MADLRIREAPRSTPALRYYDFAPIRSGRLVMGHKASGTWKIIPSEWPVEVPDPYLDIEAEHRGPLGALADRLIVSKPIARLDYLRVGDQPEEMEPAVHQLVDDLVDSWFQAGAHQASVRRAAKHPSFGLLRRLGTVAIERIVHRLRRDPNPMWIWALGELTGQDPASGAETVPAATQAWLAWADERGLG